MRRAYPELEARRPEDNRLDASARLLERAMRDVPASGGGTGSGDMTQAVYDTNGDGRVDEVGLVSSALPTAGSTYQGRFWYVAGSGGTVPGTLFFCARDSAGGYEWIVVAQTSV